LENFGSDRNRSSVSVLRNAISDAFSDDVNRSGATGIRYPWLGSDSETVL
jgi:hypothetical protein